MLAAFPLTREATHCPSFVDWMHNHISHSLTHSEPSWIEDFIKVNSKCICAQNSPLLYPVTEIKLVYHCTGKNVAWFVVYTTHLQSYYGRRYVALNYFSKLPVVISSVKSLRDRPGVTSPTFEKLRAQWCHSWCFSTRSSVFSFHLVFWCFFMAI